MRVLLLSALLLVPAPTAIRVTLEGSVKYDRGNTIARFHDEDLGATCWVMDTRDGLYVPPSISCLPDSQLKRRR